MKNLVFSLPENPNPKIFGSEYWKAFEILASNIPCDSCRIHAEEFVSYWHDLVNVKTSKEIFNKKNFLKYNLIITFRFIIFKLLLLVAILLLIFIYLKK